MAGPNIVRFVTAAILAVACWPMAAAGQVSIFADGRADARIAAALADLDRVVAAGGWPALPAGPALRRGAAGPRVMALRSRLVASRDLPAALGAGSSFDRLVERAVRRFQERHGLVVDGIVGPMTLAAFNVPATARRATLSLNRARLAEWRRHVGGTGLVANIPDATLELLEGGRRVFRSRIVVGKPSWPTPVLHSAIYAIDVNPKWYVPDRIAQYELLPRARRDPDYLRGLNIRVFATGRNGEPWLHEVPYDRVDFARFGRLGYRLRQDSGPDNALGLVKFVFENPYNVFLHDSPHKDLFGRADRSLSHGCIRVAAALDLARHFAAREPGLDAADLAAAIAAGETRRLALTRPVPIHIVYLTAWVDARGRAQFRRDIYRHDRPGTRPDAALAACGVPPKPSS